MRKFMLRWSYTWALIKHEWADLNQGEQVAITNAFWATAGALLFVVLFYWLIGGAR